MRTRLLAALAVLAPAVSAGQIPAGGEFRVNTYTTGFQTMPSVASLPGGGFVVVWHGYDNAVAGQLLEPSGSFRGAEFQVAPVTNLGVWPAVAADRRGRFVVTWAGRAAFGLRIEARRFDPSGAPVGADFAVSTDTAYGAYRSAPAMQRGGGFVVVWESDDQDGSQWGVFGRLFDAAGQPLSGEFQVNTYTTSDQRLPSVVTDESGGFVVVWTSDGQDGSQWGVFGQRFHADGTRAGIEFQVNSYTTGRQFGAQLLPASDGGFVVAWRSDTYTDRSVWSRRFDASGSPQGLEVKLVGPPGGLVLLIDAAASAADDFVVVWDREMGIPPMGFDVRARRFDPMGAPHGQEFLVTEYPNAQAARPLTSIASDESGNFLATWQTPYGEVYARRYGGLLPAGLVVADGGNGVLEPADSFTLVTSWHNVNGVAQTFQGRASNVVAPTGMTLTLSPDADYGTVANGATSACLGPCFAGGLTGVRAAGHRDARFLERIVPDALGQTETWVLHVGDSFTDVPRTSPFYRFIETVLHRDVTAGCASDAYCPRASTTREQMAPFVLVAKEGTGYAPPACGTPAFPDVPASSPFCRWIEELARRGVVGGCAPNLYCPTSPVTREQMAVFVLRTLDSTLDPPACTTPMFADVPASSGFCRWIEELARRGVVTGCGGGNYCPGDAVTREQMAVFLTGTFGLTLYGP